MSKIILINGKKRSGKDFIGELIKDELSYRGHNAGILSFADPIKEIIASTFDLTDEQLNKYKNDSTEIYVKISGKDYRVSNFRKVLQRFGTESMKSWFGEDVWVQLLQQRAVDQDLDFVIVPDFRFDIEYCSDAFTLKITNTDAEKVTDDHLSENELNDFDFDFYIDNTGYGDQTKNVSKFVDSILSLE